jgi:hypothetical protein
MRVSWEAMKFPACRAVQIDPPSRGAGRGASERRPTMPLSPDLSAEGFSGADSPAHLTPDERRRHSRPGAFLVFFSQCPVTERTTVDPPCVRFAGEDRPILRDPVVLPFANMEARDPAARYTVQKNGWERSSYYTPSWAFDGTASHPTSSISFVRWLRSQEKRQCSSNKTTLGARGNKKQGDTRPACPTATAASRASVP